MPDSTEFVALRERLDLIWKQHQREHKQHEAAHAREHTFSQTAIDTAATLAKENKADANEWRGSMTDRERKFATKDDIAVLGAKIDKLEEAEIRRAESERLRLVAETKDKEEAQRRTTRSQWVIGIVVGLLSVLGAILINLVIRLAIPT